MSAWLALFTLAALLGAPAFATAQEIYQWVDESGRVHFGSEPPPGAREWKASDERRIQIAPETQHPQGLRRAPHPNPPGLYRSLPTRPDASPQPERRGGRSEAQWRAEAKRYRDKIRLLERRIEKVEDEISFPASVRSSTGAARFEASQRAKIESYEREIQQNADALLELERRARRQDVPPGWLR